MKRKFFTLIVVGGLFGWCLLLQFFLIKSKPLARFFWSNTNISFEVNKLIRQAPVLQERLFLIDRNILNHYENAVFDEEKKTCVFCNIKKGQPITFALLCPTNTSLEEHVLLPILKAWEVGFWVESVISSRPRKFSSYHVNLPLGFILQKGKGSVVIEIVLLHEREGDFWWHGSFHQDVQYKSKLFNLNLLDIKDDLVLSHEGAFDKFHVKSVVIDDIKINVPKDVVQFLGLSSQFIECNYEQADKFYKNYGKDTSPKAIRFAHKARKILLTAKAALDDLRIPFWISSGTLLGFYRQCDIIPYSMDVDIGVFISDYNDKIIKAFQDRKFKLKHKFGKLSEGFELSFMMSNIKLDVFFLYDGGDHFWNGGVSRNGTNTVIRFKYKFPKFTLCWTEFLDMKIGIPCETENYVKANYGPDWFKPVKYWDWRSSPYNVEVAGVWRDEDVNEVFQTLS